MSTSTESKTKFKGFPLGPLGIIALQGCRELGNMIDRHLVTQRNFLMENSETPIAFPGYLRDTFQIAHSTPRFASGEGKAVVSETVRGYDIFILADIGNYSCKYNMFGTEVPMSPDDHFQDIKRVIAAIGGKAHRITVIMPMLYESRQHKRSTRESLDCALALQELERMGVDNIITFDAHDPRVQNAIPLIGFENLRPNYQIIKAMLNNIDDLEISRDKMMVISPDEGGMERSLYYASMLGLDLGMFYKRRDYTRIVNGRNPIIRHEFLGDSVEGKDILISDDILSSGESMLDLARELKRRKANRIFIAVTFALFTEGLDEFNECYEKGIITKVLSTNLTYRRPELLNSPWYIDVDMSKFLSLIIDTINLDLSISPLLDPSEKIHKLIAEYKSR